MHTFTKKNVVAALAVAVFGISLGGSMLNASLTAQAVGGNWWSRNVLCQVLGYGCDSNSSSAPAEQESIDLPPGLQNNQIVRPTIQPGTSYESTTNWGDADLPRVTAPAVMHSAPSLSEAETGEQCDSGFRCLINGSTDDPNSPYRVAYECGNSPQSPYSTVYGGTCARAGQSGICVQCTMGSGTTGNPGIQGGGGPVQGPPNGNPPLSGPVGPGNPAYDALCNPGFVCTRDRTPVGNSWCRGAGETPVWDFTKGCPDEAQSIGGRCFKCDGQSQPQPNNNYDEVCETGYTCTLRLEPPWCSQGQVGRWNPGDYCSIGQEVGHCFICQDPTGIEHQSAGNPEGWPAIQPQLISPTPRGGEENGNMTTLSGRGGTEGGGEEGAIGEGRGERGGAGGGRGSRGEEGGSCGDGVCGVTCFGSTQTGACQLEDCPADCSGITCTLNTPTPPPAHVCGNGICEPPESAFGCLPPVGHPELCQLPLYEFCFEDCREQP